MTRLTSNYPSLFCPDPHPLPSFIGGGNKDKQEDRWRVEGGRARRAGHASDLAAAEEGFPRRGKKAQPPASSPNRSAAPPPPRLWQRRRHHRHPRRQGDEEERRYRSETCIYVYIYIYRGARTSASSVVYRVPSGEDRALPTLHLRISPPWKPTVSSVRRGSRAHRGSSRSRVPLVLLALTRHARTEAQQTAPRASCNLKLQLTLNPLLFLGLLAFFLFSISLIFEEREEII